MFNTAEDRPTTSKLVLYIAPTGTGKRLVRAVGKPPHNIRMCGETRRLSLARSAIAMEKKVAFAFGCNTATDIRLHYYWRWTTPAPKRVDR
jgi:hypothetical protein